MVGKKQEAQKYKHYYNNLRKWGLPFAIWELNGKAVRVHPERVCPISVRRVTAVVDVLEAFKRHFDPAQTKRNEYQQMHAVELSMGARTMSALGRPPNATEQAC